MPMRAMYKELLTLTLESKKSLKKDQNTSTTRRVNHFLWMICKMCTSKPRPRRESNTTSPLTPRVNKEISQTTSKPEDLSELLNETFNICLL